jgi:hypothetical protein
MMTPKFDVGQTSLDYPHNFLVGWWHWRYSTPAACEFDQISTRSFCELVAVVLVPGQRTE